VDAKTGLLDLRGHLDETGVEKELRCDSGLIERWGFPAEAGPANVTAIIAIVPDPVHTHLALAFDRTVDAILQAATDNNYVSSYYWLPWKNLGGGMKFAETS
jgi:hypothetical protein